MNSWYKVMSLQAPQPNVSCYVITSWFNTPIIVYTCNRGAVIWLELYMKDNFLSLHNDCKANKAALAQDSWYGPRPHRLSTYLQQ